MKKVALILLICIYSLATMGFSINQFYCCGQLKSVSIALVQNTKSQNDNGAEKSGCCDNKYQYFKVKDAHVVADQVTNPAKCFIDLYFYTPSFQKVILTQRENSIAYRSNAPPLYKGLPAYICNCVFRI